MFPNPDFELYDNAGRTTEQINSAKTGAPASADLRRWSVEEGSIPDPVGPAITAWTQRLRDAEHSEVAQLILLAIDEPDGVLSRLHEFLAAAADKLQQAGAEDAAADVTSILNRLDGLDDDLHYAAVDAWEEVNTTQRRTAATSTSPAAGTHPSSAAPAPATPTPPAQPPRPDNPRSR